MLKMADTQYQAYIKLLPLLMKLEIIGLNKHRISHTVAMMGLLHKHVKPHWIELPVTGLSHEYLEIVPLGKRSL